MNTLKYKTCFLEKPKTERYFSMKRKLLIFALLSLPLSGVMAQEDKGITFLGSVQSDMLVPQNDSETGATKTDDFSANIYYDMQLQSKYVDAGVRVEYMEHPLPGFENDFKGTGVPNFWVKGKLGNHELTLGTFYEQFGSGFILRTYEERSLGIDNSLLGGRLQLKPVKGVIVKLLSGKQRRYWSWNKALVSGADAELSLDEWIPSLQNSGTRLMLGGSWVNRYNDSEEKVFADPTHSVNMPKFINAWDVRVNYNHGPWGVLAEYAQKTDDPSYANGFIFRKGNVAMLSTTYSNGGLSLMAQAKRSENMSFKTVNVGDKAIGVSSSINHLPAFTQDHTYALAALYPYATQMGSGEWAYQAELGYNFKRRTKLGGKYGMNVKVNYSYVRGIKSDYLNGKTYNKLTGTTFLAGTEGYRTSFFKWGDNTYYQDLDITISRKFSKTFKLNFMYMNQMYNKSVVEGEGGMIHSNIFVADGMFQVSPKTKIRAELQYLATRQDKGDWACGLIEVSLAPSWMFTFSDLWNCGDTDPSLGEANTHLHYYQGLVTYNTGSHRFQIGYGRTRAGYNCAGGVCRYVPATKGVTFSYNYNF